MIKPTANNRELIKNYLESLSEDDFIDKIIVPIFNKSGYILYRMNSHGPGEHGKDIIFYRNVPIFYDHEYIVVQAKAEKITASNVATCSNQLIRALRVPFPTKTGTGQRQANYVMFINSQPHTNDANFEFPYLIDGSNNIKILSQENVIELIVNNGFVPDDIKDRIEVYDFESLDYEQEIKNIIFSKNSEKINYLFNTRLKIETNELSDNIKKFLINFIFHKWDEDRSWSGTVLPMKWLNRYFDFVQEGQYEKLFNVFEEYSSSYHSHEAYYDTCDVVRKIKPEQIKSFESKFIELVANRSLSYNLKDYPLLFEKLNECISSDLLSGEYQDIGNLIKERNELKTTLITNKDIDNREALKEKMKLKQNEIYKFLGLDD